MEPKKELPFYNRSSFLTTSRSDVLSQNINLAITMHTEIQGFEMFDILHFLGFVSKFNGKKVISSFFHSGAQAAEGSQAEPHTHIREKKETYELIFSCVSWLAVLLVGAYAR